MTTISDPVLQRMTQVMIDRGRENGCCAIDDLYFAGFTTAQILEYQKDARDGAATVLFGSNELRAFDAA